MTPGAVSLGYIPLFDLLRQRKVVKKDYPVMLICPQVVSVTVIETWVRFIKNNKVAIWNLSCSLAELRETLLTFVGENFMKFRLNFFLIVSFCETTRMVF